MRSYIFAFSQLLPQWLAQSVLNDTRAVATWVQPFPNTAIILSDLDAQDLAAVLRQRLGQTWFIVSQLDAHTSDGWLPGNVWPYVNHSPGAAATPNLPAPVTATYPSAQPGQAQSPLRGIFGRVGS